MLSIFYRNLEFFKWSTKTSSFIFFLHWNSNLRFLFFISDYPFVISTGQWTDLFLRRWLEITLQWRSYVYFSLKILEISFKMQVVRQEKVWIKYFIFYVKKLVKIELLYFLKGKSSVLRVLKIFLIRQDLFWETHNSMPNSQILYWAILD